MNGPLLVEGAVFLDRKTLLIRPLGPLRRVISPLAFLASERDHFLHLRHFRSLSIVRTSTVLLKDRLPSDVKGEEDNFPQVEQNVNRYFEEFFSAHDRS
jgi:hypothetical protein